MAANNGAMLAIQLREAMGFPRDLPLWPRRVDLHVARSLASDIGFKGQSATTRVLAELVAASCDAPPGRMVSYSRRLGGRARQGSWPHYWSVHRTISVVDFLDDVGGLIIHDRARPGRLGWQSAFMPTDELRAIWTRIAGPEPSPLYLSGPIVLRDVDGHEVAFRNTAETRRMARDMAEINEALAGADLRDVEGRSLPFPMRRIFNGDFLHGGRAYALGGSFQTSRKCERALMTIGGDPVAEPDFANCHFQLAYGAVGKPLIGDAYEIAATSRPLAKRSSQIVLNADTAKKADGAIACAGEMVAEIVGDEAARRLAGEDDPVAALNRECPDYERKARAKASEIRQEITKKHKPIQPYLHSGAGLRFQAIDSDMAGRVCLDMIAQGDAVAPIHDSFIVARRAESAVLEAMEAALSRGIAQAKSALAA